MRGLLAGIMIGIGGTCYLSIDDKIVGALLFSVGLLVICRCGLYLYTGRICYVAFRVEGFIHAVNVLIENFIGSYLVAIAVHYVRPDLIKKCKSMCENKLSEPWYITILLSIFCGVLIFFAVEGYKNGSELCIIMCVTAFIVCGFEHCIANMFYMLMTYPLVPNGIVDNVCIFWLLCILGNTIGGIGAYRILKIGRNQQKLQLLHRH